MGTGNLFFESVSSEAALLWYLLRMCFCCQSNLPKNICELFVHTIKSPVECPNVK